MKGHDPFRSLTLEDEPHEEFPGHSFEVQRRIILETEATIIGRVADKDTAFGAIALRASQSRFCRYLKRETAVMPA